MTRPRALFGRVADRPDPPPGGMTLIWSYRARIALLALVALASWGDCGPRRHPRVSTPAGGLECGPPRSCARPPTRMRSRSSHRAGSDPLGRLWLGDRISLDRAARMDAASLSPGVGALSIRGATAPELAGESPVSSADLRSDPGTPVRPAGPDGHLGSEGSITSSRGGLRAAQGRAPRSSVTFTRARGFASGSESGAPSFTSPRASPTTGPVSRPGDRARFRSWSTAAKVTPRIGGQ